MAEPGELLSATPEWADVEPWEIPPEGHAAVDIQHTREYIDAFGLLYAVIKRNELTPRVLGLTERCIMLCPSHYTAWSWRYKCLVELDADMDEEWTICMVIAHHSPKNYQLWNHRRMLAMRMGKDNAKREMEFASAGLEQDAKNYHIWAHRQAIVKTFGLWKDEWGYMEKMIEQDCRNNSAWNHRAWILGACITARLRRHLPSETRAAAASEDSILDDADDTQPRFMTGSITNWLQRELTYVRFHCERTPHNESPWNYCNGLHHIVQDAVVALDDEVDGKSALDLLPESQQEDIKESVQMIATDVFSICGDVACAKPSCVPARIALFKQYLHMAHAQKYTKQETDQDAKIQHALKKLKNALCKMNPMQGNWCHLAYRDLYGDDGSDNDPVEWNDWYYDTPPSASTATAAASD